MAEDEEANLLLPSGRVGFCFRGAWGVTLIGLLLKLALDGQPQICAFPKTSISQDLDKRIKVTAYQIRN
jgi:hypothetical protein